jgi:hypothetical protein
VIRSTATGQAQALPRLMTAISRRAHHDRFRRARTLPAGMEKISARDQCLMLRPVCCFATSRFAEVASPSADRGRASQFPSTDEKSATVELPRQERRPKSNVRCTQPGSTCRNSSRGVSRPCQSLMTSS